MPNCPICKNDTGCIITENIREGKHCVYHCENCNHAFLENLNHVETVPFQENGDKVLRFGTSPITTEEMFEIGVKNQNLNVRFVEENCDTIGNLLDIGCSSGYFIFALQDLYEYAAGIDLNNNDIAFAKNKLPDCDFACVDMETFFSRNSGINFNVITAFQVLEHNASPVDFLKTVYQNTGEDAVVILSVPNYNEALYSVFDIPYYREFMFIEEHLQYFSEDSLKKCARLAGFTADVINKQLFSFNNAMSWIYTCRPMKNFNDAVSTEIPLRSNVAGNVQLALSEFMQDITERYKNILERHGLGTSLFAILKKADER